MATFAARRLHDMLDNVAHVVAIELLAAAQGVEFHRPQKSSSDIESVIASIREVSPTFTEDRSLSSDITRVADMINEGRFCSLAESIMPSLTV